MYPGTQYLPQGQGQMVQGQMPPSSQGQMPPASQGQIPMTQGPMMGLQGQPQIYTTVSSQNFNNRCVVHALILL